MDRVFLDANVLFSAAYRPNAGLLRLWRLQDVALCTSSYAMEEARINLSSDEQRARLERLAESLQIVAASDDEISREFPLPEKDRPILRAAIHAGATHLLTGDVRHFGRYFGKTIEGVEILSPAAYLKKKT